MKTAKKPAIAIRSHVGTTIVQQANTKQKNKARNVNAL
jgi:hypothetical protein